jgi:CRP-like cAMP-binding protein
MIGANAPGRKACSFYYGKRCQMATPMTTMAFDTYIVDTLMPDLVGHDRQPSAFLVYLCLWRQTHGHGKPTVQVALLDIAEATGLSKRAVQDALGRLATRKLITVARESITAVPVYTVLRPWRR